MKTKIKRIPLKKLEKKDLYSCSQAILTGSDWTIEDTDATGSSMSDVMKQYRKHPQDFIYADAIIIKTLTNDFIGWCLSFQYKNTLYYEPPDTAYFYIHKKYRRQGYGTLLFKHLESKRSDFKYVPWNKPSIKFFSKLDPEYSDRITDC